MFFSRTSTKCCKIATLQVGSVVVFCHTLGRLLKLAGDGDARNFQDVKDRAIRGCA